MLSRHVCSQRCNASIDSRLANDVSLHWQALLALSELTQRSPGSAGAAREERLLADAVTHAEHEEGRAGKKV